MTTLVSFGHCIDCPSIYGFWWRRWYLLAIVLTVLLFTASDDHLGIFWPLYWLSFYLRLLMTTLVSFGHCIDCLSIYGFWWPPWYLLAIALTVSLFTLLMTTLVYFGHCIDCPSIYGFWWPRWYPLAIVLTVLLFTASDDHVGIFWPLYWLFFYLRLLMTTLVSFGHCIDCPSIYSFWLPCWYLLAIVLTVLLFTASDYHVGIFWPLYWLSFYLRLLMTTLVSFGHCIDCPSIYGFWLPPWYLLAIVLTVLLFTASDDDVGIFWPLYWLSFYLRLLITTLVSLGHCIDCSSIYGFSWRRWYLLAIVLTVLLFTASDDHVGIFWPLYWLSFYLQLLMTTLVSFGHCIDCSSIYGFWWPRWYLLAIVLTVLLFTASDYHVGIFWPLYWLSFYLQLLITTLVSFGHCIDCPSIYGFWWRRWYLLAIVLTVLLFTASDYHIGIFWPLYWLSFYLRLLMTTLVSFGHCIDCPIYGFWLPRWYLLAIALTVPLFTASDDDVGIFWPLHWLSFYLRLLMTTLVSFGHCIDCPSIYGFWWPRWYLLAIVLTVLLFTASDYHVGIFWPLHWLFLYLRLLMTTLVSFGHCIDCPSIYGFWWPRWYLLAIVLTVLLFTASDYHVGIFWPLYYLSFYLRLLITTLVSFGHCIDCPSIYGFWWRRWYLLVIVLTVLLFTASDDHVGIFWPLYWLSFYLRLLMTTLVSFGHCIDCPSIYGFWWPRCNLLAIALTVLFTASDYHVGIFWPLYWLSFYLRLLITTLVSFGHCIDCPSIYGFWLPRWYLLAIALTVPLFTASDDDVGIFWPLYWLSFYLRLLMTTLVSFGHCIDCPSIYSFWLPRWYLLAIAVTVPLFTASDDHVGIFWPLYWLSFYLRLLMTTLVSFGHCIDCPSIYGFWLPRWYILAIVLSVLLFTTSDYHVGIFWPLYWLSFYLRLLITTLVSFGHCIDCPSLYGFWWPRWYHLAIVLTVLLFTASDDHVGIFWPLYWLSFYLRLLMTTLVSFGHCIDCPIYGFWLPRWYLLAIVLTVLLFTASDYHVGIFWPLYWLFFYLPLLMTTLVSFGHCIDCPSIYGFSWPRWYILAIVLTVLLFTASDYHVDIFWPLYWLSFYLRLLITTLLSLGHCIDCSSIYGFWWRRSYLLAIVLTVLLFTASDDQVGIFWPLYWLSFYLRLLMTTLVSFGHCIDCFSIYASDDHLGIFWPLYWLSFHLRLLMTTLVSFGHCIDCPSIYGFWLPRWYLLAIALTVPLFTASDDDVGIFWPLYWLSFYLRLLMTTLVSFGHCIDCPSIYSFWLPRWYLLAIALTVPLFTASDDHVGIFWPLYWLSFYLRPLMTTLVSFGHCIDCPIYGFWLPRWYILAIVLSVLLFTTSDYHVGIFWPLYWLSFYLRLLITTLVSFGHCIDCTSIYSFWWSRWYLLAIVLTVLLFTASDDHVGIFWPLHWLFFYLRLLMTTLVSFGHCIDCTSIYSFWLPCWYLLAIVLTVLLFTASDYHVGIFWPLYWLSFYLRLLMTTLVSFGHCIDCPSIYGFWLPHWYLLAIVLTVLLFTASDDDVGIFWPLYWLSYLRLLITTLVSLGHCIDCSSIYGFWWRRWYLLAIALTVLLFTASDDDVGIFWPLYWLSFYLRLLMTTLVSFGHCIDCPSIYSFWLPRWYLLTIALTVPLFTASDDHVGIFWPLYWLSFYLRLLMTTLVSFGHCIDCPSIYGFWLPRWYILAIVLSVLLFTTSDYHVGIFWPLYWLSFYLRLLMTTLVSFGHCIDCPSIYGFWWPRWYILAIVLTVLLFTASDDHVGIFWPLYWLSFYLRLLMTTL